jgi:hypothetical protein
VHTYQKIASIFCSQNKTSRKVFFGLRVPCTQTYLSRITKVISSVYGGEDNLYQYIEIGEEVNLHTFQKLSRNRPWRPRGLWDVEAPIFSGQSAHIWRWGCQPYAPAAIYPQENSWYSFLLEVIVRLEGLGQVKNPNDLIGNRTRDLPASRRTMALGSTQPLTEMSTRNIPGGKGRPARGADNLTTICEPIV